MIANVKIRIRKAIIIALNYKAYILVMPYLQELLRGIIYKRLYEIHTAFYIFNFINKRRTQSPHLYSLPV